MPSRRCTRKRPITASTLYFKPPCGNLPAAQIRKEKAMSEALINKLAVLNPRQRERTKQNLLARFRAAKRVKPDEARAALERQKKREEREREEEGWMLTR